MLVSSGASASASSGRVEVRSSSAGENGASGSLLLATGNAGTGESGSIGISTGDTTSGRGGDITLSAGRTVTAAGADVSIKAGASTLLTGGSVLLASGSSQRMSTGSVSIMTPNSGSDPFSVFVAILFHSLSPSKQSSKQKTYSYNAPKLLLHA